MNYRQKDQAGPALRNERLPPSLLRPNYAILLSLSHTNALRPSFVFPLYFLEYVRLLIDPGEGQLRNCLVFDTIFRTSSVDYAHLGRPDSRLSVSTALSRRRHSGFVRSVMLRSRVLRVPKLFVHVQLCRLKIFLYCLIQREKKDKICVLTRIFLDDTHINMI